jgi:demethylmenaquinone methyltransferase/2-methoxy-6-polyprenyl-1,4-benzoquinol methylase
MLEIITRFKQKTSGLVMSKSIFIKKMFNDISPWYDTLNDVLSLSTHRWWKRAFVQKVISRPHQRILDCATGTGDIAFLMEKNTEASIIAIDFSEKMIQYAQGRAKKNKSNVLFSVEDISHLTFADKSFDAVTVSFGIRNVEEVEKGLKELSRVSRNIYILEFGQPKNWLISKIYFTSLKLYFPLFSLFSGRSDAYEYLIHSSQTFPSGDDFIDLLKKNTTFQHFKYTPLFFGVVYIYQASNEAL